MALHAFFQICFYLGPFLVDDAVPVAVARATIGHDDVVAKDAFMLRAERLDCGLRLEIVVMCFEGHAARAHHFKSMAKLYVFGFDVDAAALIVGEHPGPADFERAVGSLDVGEARGADNAVVSS